MQLSASQRLEQLDATDGVPHLIVVVSVVLSRRTKEAVDSVIILLSLCPIVFIWYLITSSSKRIYLK